MNRNKNIRSWRTWTRAALIGAAAALAFAAAPADARVNDESSSYYDEAKTYLQKGDVRSAIIHLKNAIRADPQNVQARFDLALLYLRGRDGPSEEKELKAARDRGMEENNILLPLAQAYALQGKNEEILAEIKPDGRPPKLQAGVLAARGGAYVALKDLDKAEQSLDEAVKAAPDSPFVLLAFSQVLQARGKLK